MIFNHDMRCLDYWYPLITALLFRNKIKESLLQIAIISVRLQIMPIWISCPIYEKAFISITKMYLKIVSIRNCLVSSYDENILIWRISDVCLIIVVIPVDDSSKEAPNSTPACNDVTWFVNQSRLINCISQSNI